MTAPRKQALRLPFLNGVYVAIDAIDGAYLIVDGPYCVFTKAEMQYCHNLRCRLLPHAGFRRVVHTAQASREEVRSLSLDRTAEVSAIVDEVRGRPDASLVFATSFDFHELVGFPLRELAAARARAPGPPVLHVPSKSLGGDWLEGYALVCEALARELPLRRGRTRRGSVALVGYLKDRDEPDHAGNLRELERLLGALGLRLEAVWLSGAGRAGLERAERAELVLSLPYAREAARVVAQRCGSRLVELELPLGLEASERFLLEVGGASGRRALARRLAERESREAVRAVEAHVLRALRGRRAVVFQNDPHLAAALAALCGELGLETLAEPEPVEGEPPLLLLAPTLPDARDGAGRAHVPIGYPNYRRHPVTEAPFLGFAGFRRLVDDLSTAALAAAWPGGRS